jgi:transcriptional regulator with XRE-family HTH domain
VDNTLSSGIVNTDVDTIGQSCMLHYMEAIREYLQATGQSQSEFAKRVGVSRSTVTLWLQGKRHPTIDRQLIIWNRTGIGLDKLREERET